MTKRSRVYTEEFKREAVKLALSSASVREVAKELGIPGPTLHIWVHKAKKSGDQVTTADDGVVSPVNISKILEDHKRLKKQLARLEQEKSILKKAATYFAKELE